MGLKWSVTINGEVFEKEATRASYAVQCALHDYARKYKGVSTVSLKILVQREDMKRIPMGRVAKVL